MSHSPVYYENRQRYGWDTPSHGHHAHISTTEGMPGEVPRYPNVYKLFNNKITYEEELPHETSKEHSHKDHKKKVQVIETIEEDTNPTGQVYEEVIEETVDSEADSYIQKSHRGFELRRWKTFDKN